MSSNRDKSLMQVLKIKSSATVAIFDRGDHYKCYEQDALLVANEIFLSDVGIRKVVIEDTELCYLNLNNAQYIKVVKDLLLLLRYRVEVYEEVGGNFQLKAKGVLGNMIDFEDIVANCEELLELSTSMCVRLAGNDFNQENHVSVCFCNSEEMRITFAEFNDNRTFTLLEQCIVSMNPRECVLFDKDKRNVPDRFNLLEKALKRSNLQMILVPEPEQWDAEVYRSGVRGVLKPKFKGTQFSDSLVQGMYLLLKHMQLLNNSRWESAFALADYGSMGYMYVSNATLQALEIFSLNNGDQDANPMLNNCRGAVATTLYDHLNKCRSQPGRQLLRKFIRRPLFDLRSIKERHDVVEALVQCHSARQLLHNDLLRRVPDIELLIRRLRQKRCTLQDCFRLFQVVLLLDRIEAALIELMHSIDASLKSSVKELVVESVWHSMAEFKKFAELIRSTMDLDYHKSTGQFRINPNIDEDLSQLAQKIAIFDGRADAALKDARLKMQTDSVKLEKNAELGYYFRVTLKMEKAVRNASASCCIKILDATKGGGMRFTNPTLDGINVKFLELQAQYESCQSEIAKAVINTCASYIPALQLLSERLGLLDVLTTFAVVSSSSSLPYVRPQLMEKGTGVFQLKECRHPIIEQLPNVQYIPNDVQFGNNGGETNFIVLTGANMGGKSTYLRATALTVYLAQMGCFVPCLSARFSLVDGIFTRVGAADFQSKGISTFMAEMIDCATIFETATENSLIVIDELGRGTSTYDGFGLAWAIAEEIIINKKCFCLFATHFHEITRLQERYPNRMENYKVETVVDEAGMLTILYQVTKGVANRSLGLNIAKLVGFPEEIVEDAAKILNELENNKPVRFG